MIFIAWSQREIARVLKDGLGVDIYSGDRSGKNGEPNDGEEAVLRII